MNGDMYMHIKNSLAQVKDKNNLSIFYVKSGEKISTTVNLAGGNLPIDPILCKSSLKGKNVPNSMAVRNVLTIFQINEIFI